MAMETCGKSLYASQKVRQAVEDGEVEVSVALPKAKAKVVVLGDSGVGKTSIIYRHRFGDHITPFNATIGASFVSCDVETPTEDVLLQIWDTAGQERFRCMVPLYMRKAAAAIIVYDISCRQSFLDVDKWALDLQRCCGSDDPKLVLIGNKADLSDKRQVNQAEGITKALKLNARFYEISGEKPMSFSRVLEDLACDLVTDGLGSEVLDKSPCISPRGAEIEEMEVIKKKCCGII